MSQSESDPTETLRRRLPYEAIVDRPALRLPNGARVAVWVIVNVEHWHAAQAMPRTVLPPPMGQPLLPDLPNWSWHEYGMRVGFWRILDALKQRNIRATLAVNGSACELYARACVAACQANWEFIGHGWIQKPMHRVEDQVAAIQATQEAIRRITGANPRGWESPGLTENDHTLDLLCQAGIEYVCDWVLDDLPVSLQTLHGPIHAIPYTVEVNDVVMTAVQQHRSDEILLRGRDQFNRLYQEGAQIPRVMAISLHPYLTGVPHRVGYLEALLDHIQTHSDVVIWTGGQILDWYRSEIART